MSWASSFPEQLTEKPVGLVALTGLDLERSQSHKAVFDAFTQHRKGDRLPLRFARFPVDHEYPKSKPKKPSYEWYTPKGLLKSNWLRKHLYEVPSVVVIFFDLDWDDPQFREKQLECASRVRVVRECLAGRFTNVVVVLLQKKPPLPLEEDLSAKERAPALCSACELNPNHLFVLVRTEHLYGYIIRLESAFFDLSQNYYHQEARKVKSHRDHLNKISHQLLFVRHQFKIAVYHELKQDPAAALKHYKECYNHVLDLRLHEKHVLETKVVAGFVNYKICRLLFQKNAMDAIKQFKAFVDFFKDRVGMMELAFEHFAWLSKQNEMFAELFNDAVRSGLSAVQMQHPGIYYQEAAKHAAVRKNHSQKLCRFVDLSDRPNPLADLNCLDFYGQRPWRQGNQSFDPPDYTKERNGIQALQNEELRVNLSAQIISLLSQAVHYFKKYKSPRTKQQLYVQMSEEHYSAKQYSECLSCLLTVLDDYRREAWWTILTFILQLCLRCAFLLQAPQPYVHACLELMNSRACATERRRLMAQASLVQLLRSGAPNAPPEAEAAAGGGGSGQNSGADEVAGVREESDDWRRAADAWLAVDVGDILVDMDRLASFLSCKVAFASRSCEANLPVRLNVYLFATCVQELQLTQLSAVLSNSAYNSTCCLSEPSSLLLQPNRVSQFAFDLTPERSDVGHEVSVVSVTATIAGQRASVRMRWRAEAIHAADNPFEAELPDKGDRTGWEQVRHRPTVRLLPKPSQLSMSVRQASPALANEFHAVTIELLNSECRAARNCRLTMAPAGRSSVESDDLHVSCETPSPPEEDGCSVERVDCLQLGDIGPGETLTRLFWLQTRAPGVREMRVSVSYETDCQVLQRTVECSAVMTGQFTVTCVQPFEILCEVQSMSFVPMTTVSTHDPFVLSVTARSQSPWPIELEGSEARLHHHVRLADGESSESRVAGLTVKESECVTECWIVTADGSKSQSVKLGNYHLRWRRAKSEESPFVSTIVTMPTVGVHNLPLMVTLGLPALGILYEPLELLYTLENRTAYPQEVEFGVERTEAFMFSGMKASRFRILPQCSECIEFSAYPLATGLVRLPQLSIKLDGADFPAYTLLKDLHSHLFVKPLGRGEGDGDGEGEGEANASLVDV